MCGVFQNNFVFLHQVQWRLVATLKAGARVNGNGREKDSLEKTFNGKAEGISQSHR